MQASLPREKRRGFFLKIYFRRNCSRDNNLFQQQYSQYFSNHLKTGKPHEESSLYSYLQSCLCSRGYGAGCSAQCLEAGG